MAFFCFCLQLPFFSSKESHSCVICVLTHNSQDTTMTVSLTYLCAAVFSVSTDQLQNGFSEMLNYEVFGFNIDVRYICLYEIILTWKLTLKVALLKHLLESMFFDCVDKNLIHMNWFSFRFKFCHI